MKLKNFLWELFQCFSSSAVLVYSRGNTAGKRNFGGNIEKMFDLALPGLGTADKLMRKLSPDEIELIKQRLVNKLIIRKVLNKLRFMETAISAIISDDFDKEALFYEITQSNCQLRYLKIS